MKRISSVFGLFIVMSAVSPRAHAIIFLPALILIPIAKIVAIIIGGLALPALGIGTIWSKLFGKSLTQTLLICCLLLALLAVIISIFLKLHTPQRPLF